jgi:hypothetical protein
MTQPPSPEQLATTEEIHAGADEFVNVVLTDAVSGMDAGNDLFMATADIGAGLLEMAATPQELTMIAARALARLARMHHAVEQLADLWTQMAAALPAAPTPIIGETVSPAERQAAVEAIEACTEDLRKLVDDHG